MMSTFEIGKQRMLDLLDGKEVSQGEVAIVLSIDNATLKQLIDERGEGTTPKPKPTPTQPKPKPTPKKATKKKATKKKATKKASRKKSS